MDVMQLRRNLLMQKTGLLPKGYQQVEYLENSGGSYIDTGIIPTPQMRVIVEGRTSNNVDSAGFIFGSRKDDGYIINSEMWWGITWNKLKCSDV